MSSPANHEGSFSGGVVPPLTSAERECMRLLCEEFMTKKQIAIRRGTSVRAVQKILQSAAAKGGFAKGSHMVRETNPGCEPPNVSRTSDNATRLHGEQFTIGLLYRDQRYLKRLETSANQITIEGSTVKLWRDKIEVYSCKSFYGTDANTCDAKACTYWMRFFTLLENDFKIIIVKDRAQNVRRVAQHYEKVNGEFGEYAVEEGRQIRILHEDGRLRFVTDRSLKMKNHEALHPDTAKADYEVVEDHLKDWFSGAPKNSELASQVNRLLALQVRSEELHVETASAMRNVLKVWESQLPREFESVAPDQTELRRYTG